VGEGDGCPFDRGGRKLLFSSASNPRPLVIWCTSEVGEIISVRLPKTLVVSPTFVILTGLGEAVLAAAFLFVFAVAICSKWDRKEETGFWAGGIKYIDQDVKWQRNSLWTSHRDSLPQTPPSRQLTPERSGAGEIKAHKLCFSPLNHEKFRRCQKKIRGVQSMWPWRGRSLEGLG
jgi:hypothetical protein